MIELAPQMREEAASLPVADVLPEIGRALADAGQVVIEAPPGAGKTTLVPLSLLDAPWRGERKILMLEPRRLAARAAAQRMAALLGEEVGQTVGYAMRFERRTGPRTRIEVVTEGLLTRRLQADPELADVAAILFDEVHERSLDGDLGLALALDARENLRPDLRIGLMSATLDGAGLAALLGDAPLVRSDGRLFPVAVEHFPPTPEEPVERTVNRAVRAALGRTKADILAILPGAAEIRRAASLLADVAAEVHPLMGELVPAAQQAAIRPSPAGRRKIVLATNIAETSLTIEGVSVVVDGGLERRPRFSPRTGMSRLVTVRIARSSAEQRRGRAGRLGPGLCLRLWTAEEDRGLAPERPPEIAETDLAPLALELAAWGEADPMRLRWPTPPPAGAMAQAGSILQQLEAVDRGGRITPLGRRMAELPVHPRLAHMLLAAGERNRTALWLAALLSSRDPIDRSSGSDMAERLERIVRGEGEPGRRRELSRVREQLARRAGLPADLPPRARDVGPALALAFPDRIAQRRRGGGFKLANGRGAELERGDPLKDAAYLVAAEIEDAGPIARIRRAAALDEAGLREALAHRLEERESIAVDALGTVRAERSVTLGEIALESRPIRDPDPEAVGDALLAALLERGLPWSKAADELRARMRFLATREPERWPDVSEEALRATAGDWLRPWLHGVRKLGEVDLDGALQALVGHDRRAELDRRAPARIELPAGGTMAIDYGVDPPSVAVRLQAMFGTAVTPTVDDGRCPLVLQLLSPAQRPIAVTRDLASFWSGGYVQVRKELRGRYPKHPWPDDPLAAPPTLRTKKGMPAT